MKFAIPLLFLLCIACSTQTNTVESTLQPWSENSYYWSSDGKPLLLLGGSDDDNLFQWPEELLLPQLDRLAAAGGNVIRNTMSDRKDQGFEEYPFFRQADGLYDLGKWNPLYWTRFEQMLRETAKRHIFVQIEIWDRFDYTDVRESNRWQIHPYNPKNNVNYSYEEAGFAEYYPDHPGANKQPFFFTTPEQQNNTVVLRYQQNFVNKLLDHSLKYDHILYCMDNETQAEEAWGRFWANFVKTRAVQAGKKVMTTEMWDAWDLSADEHKQTFDHPELYDFVDVSQNNHNKGQKHWDNFLYVKTYLSDHPRPMNTTKTYGANGNKFGHSDQDAIERFWRHLLAGAASIRFHRPNSGLGLNDKAVACIHAARKLESLIPVWEIQPAMHLLTEYEANEAYCAANAGQAIVVYFPTGGSVVIDVSDMHADLKMKWINIDTGEWGGVQECEKTDHLKLTSPGPENWTVVIRKK